MFKEMKELRLPLLLLLLFTVLCVFLYQKTDSDEIKDIFLSLGTGFISTVVTVIILDIFVSAKEARSKRELSSACLRTLRPALAMVANTIFEMHKATSTTKGSDGLMEFPQLFATAASSNIRQLHPGAYAPVWPGILWPHYVSDSLDKFAISVNDFIDKYSVHLDAETISLCYTLANHGFVHMMRYPKQHPFPNMNMPIFSMVTTVIDGGSPFTNYLIELSKLSRILKDASYPDDFLFAPCWSDGVAPGLGSGLQAGTPPIGPFGPFPPN
ncbi:hypothetical protein PHLH8_56590 [Pseudomonas sp. Pc102]|uniref:hypothetical protein n=1 Tax=Pseudomonas sp. Pc102 TaxID=2678261 RepID=UPI001BCCD750|nr:hypothetical protein [Pseudomonas sp. Pc102]BBP86017.1 hypothetical protein PHLH8_56590 [Pseudomonas sp. Pc102]